MAWYKSGTVTVTNGSATVTGDGTAFVSNVVVGDAFQAPDGRSYEVAAVVSATELTLARAYLGATGGGQAYTIQPTSSFAGDLAARVVQLIGSFGAVRDGIGQGLIADGSPVAPGIRFTADQDTGLRRVTDNLLALVAGGVDGLYVAASGNIGIGQSNPAGARLDIAAAGSSLLRLFNSAGAGTRLGFADTQYAAEIEHNNGSLRFKYNGTTEGFRLQDGNLLVGVTSAIAGAHTIGKPVAQGTQIFTAYSSATSQGTIQAFAVESGAWGGAAMVVGIGCNTTTGRSINAAGTLNASGADYAEYMVKADACDTIAAGDVCGVDRDGRLTRSWADAVSFVVKSTDPAYVGGDTWSAHLPPRPEKPVEPVAPPVPPQPGAEASEAEAAAWVEAMRGYQTSQAAFTRDHAAWEVASAAYARDLAAWEAALEAARQTVDRIAFAGQVPVNMTTPFAVGDYLVAAQDGAGITAIAVAEADITFPQYRRRLGKVWAVRDGRPWIDVQHG